jgi:hypothetical protein
VTGAGSTSSILKWTRQLGSGIYAFTMIGDSVLMENIQKNNKQYYNNSGYVLCFIPFHPSFLHQLDNNLGMKIESCALFVVVPFISL